MENGKIGKKLPKCLTTYIFSSLIHIIAYILRDGKCKQIFGVGQTNKNTKLLISDLYKRIYIPFNTVHVRVVVNLIFKGIDRPFGGGVESILIRSLLLTEGSDIFFILF